MLDTMNFQTLNTPARPTGGLHTIGQAAAVTGISARMIRHYEAIGLIPRTTRTAGNYRTYDDGDIHTLRFILRARKLGFSMAQIRTLVSLWRNRSRSSAQVRKLATDHIDGLRQKIEAMQTMVRTLETLATHCHGDGRPDCPILDDLAQTATTTTKRRVRR